MIKIIVLIFILFGSALAHDHTECRHVTDRYVPEAAWEHRDLLRGALMDSFGNFDLLSHSAAKVMQESAWDCTAYSKYAGGCSQFTQSTAKWISRGECRDLGDFYPGIVEDPEWALPCMVRYDRFHYTRVRGSDIPNKIAKTDSAYNGGLGWLRKDEALCKAVDSCDFLYWYGNVENYSDRATWAIEENRKYVDRINNFLTGKYIDAGYGGMNTGQYRELEK